MCMCITPYVRRGFFIVMEKEVPALMRCVTTGNPDGLSKRLMCMFSYIGLYDRTSKTLLSPDPVVFPWCHRYVPLPLAGLCQSPSCHGPFYGHTERRRCDTWWGHYVSACPWNAWKLQGMSMIVESMPGKERFRVVTHGRHVYHESWYTWQDGLWQSPARGKVLWTYTYP